MFILTFFTILGVTEMLCSLRLVLEKKTGKEIPELSRLEFLEKFSANNCALSDAKDNTSVPLSRGGIADLLLLRTLLVTCPESQASESDGLFCFISIGKFGSSKNLVAIINSMSEIYFRFRRLIFLEQTKKVISMNSGRCTSSWNHGDKWALTWYFRSDKLTIWVRPFEMEKL